MDFHFVHCDHLQQPQLLYILYINIQAAFDFYGAAVIC